MSARGRSRRDLELTIRERVIVALAGGRGPFVVAREFGVDGDDVDALARSFGYPATVRNLRDAKALIDAGDSLHAGDHLRPLGAAVDEPEPKPEPQVIEESLPDVVRAVLEDRSEGDASPDGWDDDCEGCYCHITSRPPCGHCTGAHEGLACDPNAAPEPAIPADLDAIVDVQDIREHEAQLRTWPTPGTVDPQPWPTLDVPPGTPEVTAEPAPRDRATLRIPLGRIVDVDGAELVLGWGVVDVEVAQEWLLAILDDPMNDSGNVVRVTSVRREWTPEGIAAVRQLAAALPAEAAS